MLLFTWSCEVIYSHLLMQNTPIHPSTTTPGDKHCMHRKARLKLLMYSRPLYKDH